MSEKLEQTAFPCDTFVTSLGTSNLHLVPPLHSCLEHIYGRYLQQFSLVLDAATRVMALRSSALSIAIFLLSTVFAQDCFYPNGSLSTGDSRESPCGGSTSICCPLNWECMSNGLCYYPPDDFYGRYSCTDETWGACPDICTYDYNAYGGEAILQCSNGKYCCDKDRSFDCCTVDDTDYFPLPAGKSIASISALAEVTTPASTVHNAQSTTTGTSVISSTSRTRLH